MLIPICAHTADLHAPTLIHTFDIHLPPHLAPHVQYLPGIIALFALLMITAVQRYALPPPVGRWPAATRVISWIVPRSSARGCATAASRTTPPPHTRSTAPPSRRDTLSYDSFGDDGEFCRARGWLLLAYLVSFAAVAGAVLVMLHRFATEDAASRWVGVAAVLEVAAILGSGLVFFVARAPDEEADYGGF